MGERGNIFNWEYLEQEPEWWKVKIGKRRSGENDETLGQIAAKDLHKARVFQKYGLDFCCGGRKTVKEACGEKGLDVTKIEQELQQIEISGTFHRLPEYNEWKLDFLEDYIVNTHHYYVKKTFPEIITYAEKVGKVHGDRHPELERIYGLLEIVNAELTSHMAKEEDELFPYIKRIAAAEGDLQSIRSDRNNPVQNMISMIEMEHALIRKNMDEIRALSNNYTLPEDACASYGLLFQMLPEFETDLYLHLHLENNILFPKALEEEKRI